MLIPHYYTNLIKIHKENDEEDFHLMTITSNNHNIFTNIFIKEVD